jgi:hypothetical protein
MSDDGCELHLDLAIDGNPARKQPVSVRHLRDGLYQVLFTPGFVDGIAADDVIRADPASGQFEVVVRGGNVAIKVFSRDDIGPVVDWIMPRLRALDGRLDGRHRHAAAITVPVGATFETIEAVMAGSVETFPGIEWYFANVYDDRDQPLDWWK